MTDGADEAASIQNGTSNVRVIANSNVTIGVAGTSNVAVFATTGEYVTGVLSASGNISTGANLVTSGTTINSGVTTTGTISATGNITGGNISATNHTGTTVSVSGNVTGANFLTGGLISSTGGITSAATVQGLTVSATGNVQGGNLRTAGLISATGGITGAALVGTSLSLSTGTATLGNITNGNGDGVGNIGGTGAGFNTVFAKATSAQYADLAENYLGDALYVPGTVVSFGGAYEVTMSLTDLDPTVAGIVSTDPAYLMNSTLVGDHVVALALTGRVPCRVEGPVTRGAMMVSAGNGRARAEKNPAIGTVIGKAVESFDGNIGTIEIVVGRL